MIIASIQDLARPGPRPPTLIAATHLLADAAELEERAGCTDRPAALIAEVSPRRQGV